MYSLLRYLPRNHLSWLTGQIAAIPWPRFIAPKVVGAFARLAGIDVSSASKPISEFRSIAEFFVRDLKPGLRNIEGEIISPVDSKLRRCGPIDQGFIPQVKGKTFGVRELLGNDPVAQRFTNGDYFNFYLAPPDYHHVHSPVSGKIIRRIYVPGTLWPVNGWGLANIDSLFSKNERIISIIESPVGLVAVVMVGAANVGKMSLTYDDTVTNQLPRPKSLELARDVARVNIAVGERLGTFHLGSTVVLLFEPGKIDILPKNRSESDVVFKYGQLIATPKNT